MDENINGSEKEIVKEIHHVVEGELKTIDDTPDANLATYKPNLFKLKIFILIVIFVGILVAFISKLNVIDSSGVKRSYSLSSNIHNKYLPIWKKYFMKEHNIDEIFFKEHIFPTNTDLIKNNGSGEQFLVTYEYKLDWATFNNQDSLIIKQSEDEDYLSLDELAQREKSGTDIYDNGVLIKVDGIKPKNQVENIVSTCRSNMKPASKPFKISPFTSYGTDGNRLLYKAVIVVSNNQLVIAEVDLVTGKLNCYDADIQHY